MPHLPLRKSTRRTVAKLALHTSIFLIALALSWPLHESLDDRVLWAVITYFVGIAIVGLVQFVFGITPLMRRGRQLARSTPRTLYRPTTLEWAAYGVSLLLALGCPFYDAVHNVGPDTHPLQPDRLYLRLIGTVCIVLNFAIFTAIAFRVGRPMTRLRKGLCPTCGYDLRASLDRCPECGSPAPARSSS